LKLRLEYVGQQEIYRGEEDPIQCVQSAHQSNDIATLSVYD